MPLPPLNLSQTGKRCPKNAAAPATSPASWPDHHDIEQHRDGAFQHVGEQRRGGEAIAAGAQHIGGADAAGADRADVLRAGEPREDEPERDRPEQIADNEG